ncbi:hypothetical protein LguiA_004445 [Lonicera macranthoides]
MAQKKKNCEEDGSEEQEEEDHQTGQKKKKEKGKAKEKKFSLLSYFREIGLDAILECEKDERDTLHWKWLAISSLRSANLSASMHRGVLDVASELDEHKGDGDEREVGEHNKVGDFDDGVFTAAKTLMVE